MRLSFEFFPPRSQSGYASLTRVAEKLRPFQPDFVSVTYGAGGSTRDGTFDTVATLAKQGLDATPHLSIGSDSREDIGELLDRYKSEGVKRIVALRGDPPSGVASNRRRHNAQDLVEWIRDHSGDYFHVVVAAYPEVHPESHTPAEDLDFFRRKVDAGADSAITQFFYNPYSYVDFVNRANQAGIDIPIFPGIMPITNYEGIVRFAHNCGADIPRWVVKHLEAMQDDEKSLVDFGVDLVTTLCTDLIDAGAPGLHIYTLNRWGAASRICNNLGLAAAA